MWEVCKSINTGIPHRTMVSCDVVIPAPVADYPQVEESKNIEKAVGLGGLSALSYFATSNVLSTFAEPVLR